MTTAAYLEILARQCQRHGVSILGYCLMDNHVHLIAVPQHADSLAKAIGRTHWVYAQYVNRLHGRSGHLWQNRFYSNAMDDAHCLLAMRYVECNPIRAGICRIARRYPWSSAAAHCGEKDSAGVLDSKRWHELFSRARLGTRACARSTRRRHFPPTPKLAHRPTIGYR